MFHVGQKVVCVDDYWVPSHIRKDTALPIKGHVYTIRALGLGGSPGQVAAWGDANAPCVLLEEIQNFWRGEECYFYSRRFRPVVEKKTDISALTALLNPANHKKLENA